MPEFPRATVTPVISVEYVNNHWKPAACAPPEEAMVIGRTTEPPAAPAPEPSKRVTLWPIAIEVRPINRLPIRRYRFFPMNTHRPDYCAV